MSGNLSPIDSSMFAAHHYDLASRVMTLRYKSGAVWHYDGVSAEKNAAFLGSASKGRYFNDHIKGVHAARKG